MCFGGLEGVVHSGPSLEPPPPAPCSTGCGWHTCDFISVPSAEIPCRHLCFVALSPEVPAGLLASMEGQRGCPTDHVAPSLVLALELCRLILRPPSRPRHGHSASLKCHVRMQCNAREMRRMLPGTEDVIGKYQLAPHAKSFTFLKFLEPFPSRSASLAGHPECILSWARA